MGNNKKGSNSKSLLIGIILVIGVFLLFIGITQAFFVRQAQKIGGDPSAKAKTGQLKIDFETEEYIKNTDTKLINDTDIFTQADKTIFKLQRSETATARHISYNIFLTDIKIDDELKNGDLKWALYNHPNPQLNDIAMAQGDFSQIGSATKLKLTQTMVKLEPNEVHQYVLFMWLSNRDDVIQNELLQKKIEAKVTIEAITDYQ